MSKTNLIIDFSWSEEHNSIFENQYSFIINYLRIEENNKYYVFYENESEKNKLINCLKKENIYYSLMDLYISIFFIADVYIQPCHHIELRVKKRKI